MSFDHALEGTLALSSSPVSTGAGTSAQILQSYSMPAGCLLRTNQRLKITAFGTTAANGNTKTVALTFGATTIATATTTTSGANFKLSADVLRASNTAQVAFGSATSGTASALTSSSPAETLSGIVAITMTATDGSNSAGDITCTGFAVELCLEP